MKMSTWVLSSLSMVGARCFNCINYATATTSVHYTEMSLEGKYEGADFRPGFRTQPCSFRHYSFSAAAIFEHIFVSEVSEK
jgi:hypothetical protein